MRKGEGEGKEEIVLEIPVLESKHVKNTYAVACLHIHFHADLKTFTEECTR